MNQRLTRAAIFCAWVAAGWLMSTNVGFAEYLRIRDICRIKGQEGNALHGLGLVVGLKGTGDTELPTTRALGKMMELMGSPISQDLSGRVVLDELKNAKNVAMVFVTATVPPEGARQGGQLNVTVNAVSAKSLEGGSLLMTPLLGPNPKDRRIFGFAQGPIKLDKTGPPTAAKVHNGCRLETNFSNAFIGSRRAIDDRGRVVEQEIITLVVDKNHASFQTSFTIAELLNNPQNLGIGSQQASSATSSSAEIGDASGFARAVDQVNVEIRIPALYRENPVDFIAHVLETQIVPPRHAARVVIDQRNGNIVIGDNVMVGRVAVTHRNISIETGNPATDGPLFLLDQAEDTSTTRLKALVNALNALKVNPEDIMDIIKTLEVSGDLYGRLIVQ